jgi:hypothetical protein
VSKWGGVSQINLERQHPLRLRILLSYWYYKDIDLDALLTTHFKPPYPEIFADSGAFSAETQGVPVELDAYMAWVRRWQHRFTTYANLDVIGNWKATALNQERMEQAGLSPLPVFHVAEPWSVLEGLIERYPYIALGGLVPHLRYTDRVMPWLIKAFRLAQGKAVYHGFGVTNWEVLKALPWYSVDSSSWGAGFRYGQVPLFDSRRGKFLTVSLRNYRECYRHAAIIRELGFDPEDFADHSRYDRAKVCAISAISYLYAEAWLRRRHGEIRIPRAAPLPSGLRLYVVDGAGLDETGNYARADAGIKYYLVETTDPQARLLSSTGGRLQDRPVTHGPKLVLVEHPYKEGGVM